MVEEKLEFDGETGKGDQHGQSVRGSEQMSMAEAWERERVLLPRPGLLD